MVRFVESVAWFARGGGIAKCGPFPSQIAAVNAMRLTKDRQKRGGEFPSDIFVWPEMVPGLVK